MDRIGRMVELRIIINNNDRNLPKEICGFKSISPSGCPTRFSHDCVGCLTQNCPIFDHQAENVQHSKPRFVLYLCGSRSWTKFNRLQRVCFNLLVVSKKILGKEECNQRPSLISLLRFVVPSFSDRWSIQEVFNQNTTFRGTKLI